MLEQGYHVPPAIRQEILQYFSKICWDILQRKHGARAYKEAVSLFCLPLVNNPKTANWGWYHSARVKQHGGRPCPKQSPSPYILVPSASLALGLGVRTRTVRSPHWSLLSPRQPSNPGLSSGLVPEQSEKQDIHIHLHHHSCRDWGGGFKRLTIHRKTQWLFDMEQVIESVGSNSRFTDKTGGIFCRAGENNIEQE